MNPPAGDCLSSQADAGLVRGRIEAALRHEVARLLKLDAPADIDLSSSLGELGVDSLGFVEIAAALSREFGVRFTPEMLFEQESLDDTARCVGRLVDANRGEPAVATP